MDNPPEDRGRVTAGQGRMAGPRARDPAATSEQPPPGPQPLGQMQPPACQAPWPAAAAGGITPRWAPSPARLCLPSGAQPASCLLHRGRLSRVDRAPVSWQAPPAPRRVPPSGSHHLGGAGRVTHWTHRGQGQCGHGRDLVILQTPGWGGCNSVHRYHPSPQAPVGTHAGPRAPSPGGSRREAVWLRLKGRHRGTPRPHMTGFHLHEMSSTGKSTERESRFMASRGWEGQGTGTANGYGAPFGGNEKF